MKGAPGCAPRSLVDQSTMRRFRARVTAWRPTRTRRRSRSALPASLTASSPAKGGGEEPGRAHAQLKLAGGTDPGSSMPAYENFRLGGPLRPLRLPHRRIFRRSLEFTRLMYYNRAIALPDLWGSGVFSRHIAQARPDAGPRRPPELARHRLLRIPIFPRREHLSRPGLLRLRTSPRTAITSIFILLILRPLKRLAPRRRIERPTCPLGGGCSIH